MERLAKYEKELLNLPDVIQEKGFELAEAKQIVRRMKALKKIRFQEISEEFDGGASAARKKELALLSPQWRGYLDILLEAEKTTSLLEIEYGKYKNRYKALITAISLGKSQLGM